MRIKSILSTFSFVLSEISRNNANTTLPQNHWKTGEPSGNFNMTKYDENITKVLTYIYGDDLSLNQSDFENPDWRLKVIGPNDKNSNWTFIHSMCSKLFMIWYGYDLILHFQQTLLLHIFNIFYSYNWNVKVYMYIMRRPQNFTKSPL